VTSLVDGLHPAAAGLDGIVLQALHADAERVLELPQGLAGG
jgi:hypothetical protein